MRTRSVPVIVSSAVLAFASLAGCGRSASSYIEKANTLYSRGEYAEASLNYRKALQKQSHDGDLYYKAALAELKQNKASQAFQDLNEAVRLAPQNRDARSQLETLVLTSYLSDPKRPKALYDILVRLSQQWLAENPESPEGLRIKGYLAMLDRRPEEAVALLERAHQSNPKEMKITLALMEALTQSGKPTAAEKVGLDYIGTEKTGGDVYDALYRLYVSTRRLDDAESILVRKVKENPQQGGYSLELAAHYARTGKKPQMEGAIQSFLANSSGDPNVHLEAGDFFVRLGDWDRAIQQFNAGLAANPKQKPLYQNRIARSLISESKRDDALKLLNTALKESPDNQEARSLRAALLVANTGGGKSSEGIQEFQSLVDKNPDDLSLKYVLAKAQLESGNPSAARTQLLELVKRHPDFLEGHMLLADIAFDHNNMQEAARFSEAALQIDPDNAHAQLIRGSALLSLGNLDAAASVLGRLARQTPDSMDVRLELARLDLMKSRFKESEAAYDKILEAHPDEFRALAGLVNLDLAQNRPEHALARLEKRLQASNGAPEVRYLMALTGLRAGRYNVAIENLQRLADQSNGSIDFHLQLAQVYRLKGDIKGAIATLQKATVLRPTDSRPATMLTPLLEMQNRREEAKAQARKALSLKSDDPLSMNNMAYLLAETGDNLDEALKLARAAVAKAPRDPNFADTLGFIYMKRDKNDEALQIFDKLVRSFPQEPSYAYHTGIAWYQQGDRTKAKNMLTHALELRPPVEMETEIRDVLSRLD
ncbi:MAG: tetratricopeptide repeat protein [Acidobacteriia bacterium]|nr:tetratricopeptide repeat protein [Terriglobia bacterium]